MFFGAFKTQPLYVSIPSIETDAWGYAEDYEDMIEIEGIMDYVSGDRFGPYMTLHPDTTHILITDFDMTLYTLLDENPNAIIRDGEDHTYTVINVDDPAAQNDHLEIEVKRSIRGGDAHGPLQ